MIEEVHKFLTERGYLYLGESCGCNGTPKTKRYTKNERTVRVISKNVIFNCASVVFITKDEDPLHYDFAFNQRKIEAWKKDADASFFLSEPLGRLIPFLRQSGESSLIYLNAVEEIEKLVQSAAALQTLAKELSSESD